MTDVGRRAEVTPARARLTSWVRVTLGSAAAGGLSWGVDFAILWLLSVPLGLPIALSAATGFIVSGVVNFAANRVVFRARGGDARRQVVRYLVLFGVNLALTTIFVPIATDALTELVPDLGWRVLLGKLLVSAVLILLNVVIYKLWVFRPEEPTGDA